MTETAFAPPRFNEAESFALRVVDAMCAGRAPPPAVPVARLHPSPALSRAAVQRMAAYAHRLLLEGGGQRHRTVLRDGRRVDGRLWSASVNDGFHLEFTRASHDAWLGTARALPDASTRTWSEAQAEAFGRFVPTQRTATGDWVVYALAAHHLGDALTTLGDGRRGYTRILATGSPLARLLVLRPLPKTGPRSRKGGPHKEAAAKHFAPSGSRPSQGAAGRRPPVIGHSAPVGFSALFDPSAVRLLECLEDFFVGHWRTLLVRHCQHPGPFWRPAGEAWAEFIEAADAAERLDLTRGIMILLVAFATEILPEEPERVRRRLSFGLEAGTRASDRLTALSAVATVLAIGPRLRDLRQRMSTIGYGDPRYEENEVFKGIYDEILAPHMPRIEHLVRLLTGAVG